MYRNQMELMQSLTRSTSFCSLAGNADPKLSATRKNLKHVRICMSPPNVKAARELQSRINSTK